MQAARGTSLNEALSDRPDGPTSSRSIPHRAKALSLLVGVFAVAYVIDQVTKAVAVNRLDYGSEHSLVGQLLRVHLTRNAGAAFSTGTAYTTLISLLAIVAVLVVIWLTRRIGNQAWAAAFGLLLAGIGGNLTDRLFRSPAPLRGQVVDFLQLPHWPIFNVADVCINVAALIILLQAFRGVRLDGTRAADHRSGTPEA